MLFGITNSWLYCVYRLVAQFEARDGTPLAAKQGTAFFVRRADGEQCFITNRHLLDIGYGEPPGKYVGARLISVELQGFSAQPGDAEALPVSHNDFCVSLDHCVIRFAPDYNEDVAAVVRPMLGQVGKERVHLDYFFEAKELADDSWIGQWLTVCDFVAFPGYPSGYDKSQGRPILRTGTISSDPRANYSDTATVKGRRIAYEAFSFGGSSGSPVIAAQKAVANASGPGASISLREGRIVGINAGHIVAGPGVHSGVSYFIKSSVILSLIDGDG